MIEPSSTNFRSKPNTVKILNYLPPQMRSTSQKTPRATCSSIYYVILYFLDIILSLLGDLNALSWWSISSFLINHASHKNSLSFLLCWWLVAKSMRYFCFKQPSLSVRCHWVPAADAAVGRGRPGAPGAGGRGTAGWAAPGRVGKNPGFLKKPAQWVFWVSCFFLFFYILYLPRRESF